MKIEDLVDEVDQELFEKKVDYAKGVLKSKTEEIERKLKQIAQLEYEVEQLNEQFNEFCEMDIEDIELPNDGGCCCLNGSRTITSGTPFTVSYLTTSSSTTWK